VKEETMCGRLKTLNILGLDLKNAKENKIDSFSCLEQRIEQIV
jgi:hypothetical protein